MPEEYILSTRIEAIATARKVLEAGYRLHEAEVLSESEGYEFTYVRTGDGATATILLVPDDRRQQPDFVMKRRNPALPMCQRDGCNEAYPTPEEALRQWVRDHGNNDGYEVKPLINVLSMW